MVSNNMEKVQKCTPDTMEKVQKNPESMHPHELTNERWET
jgi:hypothetical protein